MHSCNNIYLIFSYLLFYIICSGIVLRDSWIHSIAVKWISFIAEHCNK